MQVSHDKPLVLLDPHPRNNAMIFSAADRARLESLAEVVTVESGAIPDEMVEAYLPRVVAVLGQTALPLERLNRAPLLRAVLNVEGNFFPNVDYATCFQRGIRVACASTVFARPVAEYALTLALDLMRGVTAADRKFRASGEAYGWRANVGVQSLFGAEVGIIGFGNIARILVPLLAPFRCTVHVHDPWLPDNLLRERGVQPATLDELLQRSKVVFVLAAATSENRHFLGERELGILQKGVKLVLLSRADVIDFDALLAALNAGAIEAAIDVFPEEPIAVDHPLRHCQNTILSSHRAGGLVTPEWLPFHRKNVRCFRR